MGRRITLELPDRLVDRIDELKKEWCIRARGDCLTRLLEEIWTDETDLEPELEHEVDRELEDRLKADSQEDPAEMAREGCLNATVGSDQSSADRQGSEPSYLEDKAIVLVSRRLETNDRNAASIKAQESQDPKISQSRRQGIDLPGFVRTRTQAIRTSLQQPRDSQQRDSPFVPVVSLDYLSACCKEALSHWTTLYGSKPGATVLEAVMLWMARDIWPQLDGSEGRTFTWSQINQAMQGICTDWSVESPQFEHVIVAAAALEDPFAAGSLTDRIPTLIRRFVNRFKRSRRVTSFETLESTMTLHGALRLLGLPTQAGASLTLRAIRDTYKKKAIEAHPDAGGSTDDMRRLNEAYQMLKELYRDKESIPS